jgi:RNA polymerase sigma factor (sigma-70 family)
MEVALLSPAVVPTAAGGGPGEVVLLPVVEPTDAELIQRVADGDRAAFNVLYRRYARPVYGLALRRLRDRGAAEDAVQETFMSVWRSASSYRPERGAGAPWLYTVARNAIVDKFRVQARAAVQVPATAETGPGPDEQAETSWIAWQVHRAFGTLPDNERAVLELAYWGGLSQSEVANFLGIPLGTVKTRTRSGLARLADLLESEEVA